MFNKIKIIDKDKKYLLTIIISILILIVLINFSIKKTHAYYNDEITLPLFNTKVGNFSGKGDTSTLDRSTDVNLLYYIQNLTNPKTYTISYSKPVKMTGYILDQKKSNCIPTSAKYSDYSILEDGTVKFSAVLSKPSQVVCRIYYSLESGNNDIIIYALIEDTYGSVEFDGKQYELTNEMPTSEYTYYKYSCLDSDATTNISYTITDGFKVTSSKRNTCYVYFNKQ